jgi:hypothetical protein
LYPLPRWTPSLSWPSRAWTKHNQRPSWGGGAQGGCRSRGPGHGCHANPLTNLHKSAPPTNQPPNCQPTTHPVVGTLHIARGQMGPAVAERARRRGGGRWRGGCTAALLRARHQVCGGGLSVDRLPPLTHVLGRLLFYYIILYSTVEFHCRRFLLIILGRNGSENHILWLKTDRFKAKRGLKLAKSSPKRGGKRKNGLPNYYFGKNGSIKQIFPPAETKAMGFYGIILYYIIFVLVTRFAVGFCQWTGCLP